MIGVELCFVIGFIFPSVSRNGFGLYLGDEAIGINMLDSVKANACSWM